VSCSNNCANATQCYSASEQFWQYFVLLLVKKERKMVKFKHNNLHLLIYLLKLVHSRTLKKYWTKYVQIGATQKYRGMDATVE